MQRDVESLLARLFVDGDLRERFLENPREIAVRYGLSEEECLQMEAVSAAGLQTASRSYERKRSFKCNHAKHAGLRGWWVRQS